MAYSLRMKKLLKWAQQADTPLKDVNLSLLGQYAADFGFEFSGRNTRGALVLIKDKIYYFWVLGDPGYWYVKGDTKSNAFKSIPTNGKFYSDKDLPNLFKEISSNKVSSNKVSPKNETQIQALESGDVKKAKMAAVKIAASLLEPAKYVATTGLSFTKGKIDPTWSENGKQVYVQLKNWWANYGNSNLKEINPQIFNNMQSAFMAARLLKSIYDRSANPPTDKPSFYKAFLETTNKQLSSVGTTIYNNLAKIARLSKADFGSKEWRQQYLEYYRGAKPAQSTAPSNSSTPAAATERRDNSRVINDLMQKYLVKGEAGAPGLNRPKDTIYQEMKSHSSSIVNSIENIKEKIIKENKTRSEISQIYAEIIKMNKLGSSIINLAREIEQKNIESNEQMSINQMIELAGSDLFGVTFLNQMSRAIQGNSFKNIEPDLKKYLEEAASRALAVKPPARIREF
jgi:hypothetical protein